LGLPNPTIETIIPFLFFLKARSFLQTSPPLRWLPFGSPEVFPSTHQTVPSPLSATTIATWLILSTPSDGKSKYAISPGSGSAKSPSIHEFAFLNACAPPGV